MNAICISVDFINKKNFIHVKAIKFIRFLYNYTKSLNISISGYVVIIGLAVAGSAGPVPIIPC